MNLYITRFIFKIILVEILLFCFVNSSLGLADDSDLDVIPTRDATVTWARNEDADLDGYYLYYKEDSFDSSPQQIKIEGNVTTYIVHGLDYNKTYDFWVSAYDTSGLISEPSDLSDEAVLCRACYKDDDGDGFGNPDIKIIACSCPSGYVENSDDYDDSNPRITDGSTEHVIQVKPGESIQAAIDAAHDGDVIIVLSGTYREKIDFKGKAITIKSTNPNDPSVVASTIIDGSKKGTVVTFYKNEKSDSILSGITVRNGNCTYGGGIYCTTSPTIINCVIKGNSAKYGGGICCIYSSATIKNCTIIGNSATHGGAGIYSLLSPAAIIDCTVSKNTSTLMGGGGIHLFLSSSTITNCIINKNSGATGGGIYCGYSSPRITNTIIHANSTSSYGGGGIHCVATSNPNITNCVISGNSANFYGGGIYIENSSPTITNSLFWKNLPGEIYNKTKFTYYDINKIYNENIKADPFFVNPAGGNFYIMPSSPCIDAGTRVGAPEKDKDGNQRPIGNGYDIGAYEFSN